MIISSLAALGLLLFIPGEALAWGPATHIHLGSEVLKNLSLLSPALQELLSGHPTDYLYGCVGADIIFGKKFTPYSSHCHNWKVAMQVLEGAETDKQRSFAYGYLSHLAHDMVAHNYFIPVQLVASYQTRTLRHSYWETRFDIHATHDVWDTLKELGKRDHAPNDKLLEGILEDNILPFNVNRQIFASWLFLHRVSHWKKMVTMVSELSRWPLTREEIDEYQGLSLSITFDLLTRRDDADCLKGDPTGKRNIAMAKEIRRRLKGIGSKDSMKGKTYREVLEIIQPRFRESIFTGIEHPEAIRFPV